MDEETRKGIENYVQMSIGRLVSEVSEKFGIPVGEAVNLVAEIIYGGGVKK